MSQSSPPQFWVLFGTAQASTDVWGIRRIHFPCGYSMPATAYAPSGGPLHRPFNGEVWAMGGIAFEIGKGGKDIAIEQASDHVAGYRPWIGLFHHNLLDELQANQHTIMVWDQGVSMFYGLWRDACQILGSCVSPTVMQQQTEAPVSLLVGADVAQGEAPKSYEHEAATVIHFMSQFMTLSPGDVYVLGPLVAHRIAPDVRNLSLRAMGGDFSVEIL